MNFRFRADRFQTGKTSGQPTVSASRRKKPEIIVWGLPEKDGTSAGNGYYLSFVFSG